MMSSISIRNWLIVIEFICIMLMFITWIIYPSSGIKILDVTRYIYNETIANIPSFIEDSQLYSCPIQPPMLKGRNQISRGDLNYTDLLELFPDIHNSHIKPDDCQPDQKIAIIIPFRDRQSHLNIWLKNVIPFFKRQQRDVTIFVSEQAGNQSFNRGMIKNIGFKEAARYGNFDCFIFNDVDVIPEDDRNIYHCTDKPNHMSGKVDRHQYRPVHTLTKFPSIWASLSMKA